MTREPEWTEELRKRGRDTTTFKQCGWCKWIGSGEYRHDCCLIGTCTLMSHWQRNRTFDERCPIATAGKRELKALISSKQHEIHEHQEGIIRNKKELTELLKIFRNA